MNKLGVSILILLLIIGGSFAMFYFYGASVRDKAVTKQETVNQAWGNVQSAYQRRADLIGNLVETVKGAAKTETNILVGVTEARSGIAHYADSVSGNILAEKKKIASAQTPAELEQSDMMVMGAWKGFKGFITEAYPNVNSINNFSMLQVELEGTENRISTERNRYNESVADYNAYIRGTFRKMGLNMVASEEDNFKVREPFQAKAGADEAPKVKF